MILTLLGLATKYKVDRKLIRRTMAAHDDFPSEPTKNGTYQFDTEKVDMWLLENEWARGAKQYNPKIHGRLEREAQFKEQRKQELGIAGNTPDAVQKIREELQKKTSKSDVQTKLLQLELDTKLGKMVDKNDVVTELAPVVVALVKEMETWPNLIGKKLGFSHAAIELFRESVDQARTNFYRNATTGVLSPDYDIKGLSND